MYVDSDEDAEAIATELLDVTGSALMNGDYNLFRSYFSLPVMIMTIYGQTTLTTSEEFRATFHAVRDHMSESGVVDIVRTVMSSHFEDSDTINSVHICSEIHCGGVLNRDTYQVYSTLVREELRWRISFTRYLIFDRPEHNLALIRFGRNQQRSLN